MDAEGPRDSQRSRFEGRGPGPPHRVVQRGDQTRNEGGRQDLEEWPPDIIITDGTRDWRVLLADDCCGDRRYQAIQQSEIAGELCGAVPRHTPVGQQEPSRPEEGVQQMAQVGHDGVLWSGGHDEQPLHAAFLSREEAEGIQDSSAERGTEDAHRRMAHPYQGGAVQRSWSFIRGTGTPPAHN